MSKKSFIISSIIIILISISIVGCIDDNTGDEKSKSILNEINYLCLAVNNIENIVDGLTPDLESLARYYPLTTEPSQNRKF